MSGRSGRVGGAGLRMSVDAGEADTAIGCVEAHAHAQHLSLPTTPPSDPLAHSAHSLDGLFRAQYGQLVATLTRVLGAARLELAEDATQEALLRALHVWPHRGVPDNPAGWLFRVARNEALDALRRERTLADKLATLSADLAALPGPSADADDADAAQLRDDRLWLLFGCCHPALAPEVQVALTLKALAGCGVPEIARAFLTPEATIAQRLVRAKRTIRARGLSFAPPRAEELPARLDAVLATLYLLFNEGYAAHRGAALTHAAPCAEALRLCSILAAAPVGDQPRVHALLALFLLHAARLPARVDADGALLTLAEQDRARWDRTLLAAGLRALGRAACGDTLTPYHLQAEIAACHAVAPHHAATDWRRILAVYDALARLEPSPIVRLNRAVAVAECNGTAAGLAALAPLLGDAALARYPLLHATHADFLRRLDRPSEAHAAYTAALALTTNGAEQRFLRRRRDDIARALHP